MLVLLGAVGFMDDYIKLRRKHNDGLSARAKLLGQLAEIAPPRQETRLLELGASALHLRKKKCCPAHIRTFANPLRGVNLSGLARHARLFVGRADQAPCPRLGCLYVII